jgi:fructose-1,6-bisphosphatase
MADYQSAYTGQEIDSGIAKANSALQSISSSDVTTALGYTPYNSTNPNGYTSNVGTITGITMNGSSKGTSGVVNLGTVITAHQDISGKLDTSKVKNAKSTTAGDVYDVRYINTMIGDVETILTRLTTGGGVS